MINGVLGTMLARLDTVVSFVPLQTKKIVSSNTIVKKKYAHQDDAASAITLISASSPPKIINAFCQNSRFFHQDLIFAVDRLLNQPIIFLIVFISGPPSRTFSTTTQVQDNTKSSR